MYVIQRSDGKFLRKSPHSMTGHVWTGMLQEAKLFDTEEEAASAACPSDRVRGLVDCMFDKGGTR